jgi:hypothetical protein
MSSHNAFAQIFNIGIANAGISQWSRRVSLINIIFVSRETMIHNLIYSDKNEIYSQSSQTLKPQSYAYPRGINFLICRLCFWCAYLNGSYKAAEKCPMCDNNNIEAIPVSDQEAFEFEHSQLRGVTLNFFPIHKKASRCL